MGTFQEVKDVFNTAIQLEKRLSDLYDVAEIGLKKPESKKVLRELHDEHKKKLSVLENVNVNNFGPSEWIKFPPSFDEDEIIPNQKMTKETSPEEIFHLIIDFQEQQEKYYRAILEKLVAKGQKELFASLVTFKQNQVKGIQNLMKSYEQGE